MNRKYLFIEQTLEQLQAEIKGDKKFLYKRLYEVCRLYKEQSLPAEHPDKSTTFMGMAALNLSLAYLLTKQKHYLEEAKRWIFTSVNYPHWGNKFLVDVDLSAAWMLFGLSVAYDWIKDDLTPEESTQLKDKLILQAERMYDFKMKTEGEGWSTAYWQNHNWINLTGLATAGYALGDVYPKAQDWVTCAKNNFEKVYAYMPEDGSDYEGVVYWRYGVVWLFVYAHLLKTEEGINYFEKCSFLRETFYYRLYQAAPNLEETANFGDCHDKRSGHSVAMYYKMAAEYGNGYAQYLGKRVSKDFLYREQYESKVKPGILPEAGLELLWYNPAVKEESFETLPLVKHFEDLGLIVTRSSWDEDAVHFSFKCGAPGGKKQWEKSWELFRSEGLKARGLSHQHPDNNSFILHAFDTYLSVDDGYNRTVKAREHNVITVDGMGYRNENQNNVWHDTPEEVTAEIIDFITEDGITYFAGDAYKMYVDELELTKCVRHVLYSGKGHFFMIDELASDKPHTYTFHLHTETQANKLGEGVYEYENGPGKMCVYTNIKKGNTLQTKIDHTYVKAIMTSQEPDIFREINMDTLCLENATQEKEMTLFNVLSTRDAFTEETLVVTEVQTEDAQGQKVVDGATEEVLLIANDGTITYGDIKTEAKALYVQSENATMLKVLVVGATKVVIAGQEAYHGEPKTTMIEVAK